MSPSGQSSFTNGNPYPSEHSKLESAFAIGYALLVTKHDRFVNTKSEPPSLVNARIARDKSTYLCAVSPIPISDTPVNFVATAAAARRS